MNSRMRLKCFLVCGLAGLATASHATIYSFTDAQGIAHFSDRPDDPRYQVFLEEPPIKPSTQTPSPALFKGLVVQARYHQEIDEAARNYQVDPALVHAVIEVESAYNPRAVSQKGALGLMQLMPQTARLMHVKNPFNVRDNIDGGVHLLRTLLDQFHNQLELTLAAYNAGSGQVQKYGGTIPPFNETQSFVPAVLSRYARNQRGDQISRLEKQ